MSRHTRWLRKQARAKAAEQQQNDGFSGGTAVLDRPRTARLSPEEDLELNEPDREEDWRGTEVDEPAVATDVQARQKAPPAAAPVAPPADPPPVVARAKASSSAGAPLARRVIPGREPVVETPPGERRQPHNEGWLWRDKICAGDLVVIVGDEGSGKTRVLTDWIARVTMGRAFPGCQDPTHALPPSDVLVFNCVDNFRRSVLDQVALHGGDPERVLHASTQLLDWGHSHSEFPEGAWPSGGLAGGSAGGLAGGELPEPRVRLHTQEILRKLGQFLLRRPSIRLVVIDQLKQHLKTDSERVFEELIYDLQVLGRQTEVTFVLTQRPDAFRNATGIKQYFKSESLTSVARAIWRVSQPEDPAHGDRVLECLKLNHGYGDAGREPWRLWQAPGQPLRWEPGDGREFPLSKLDAKQRLLFHAKTFIALYLRMFGGLADFETLRVCARREGITGSKLMEASIVYNFGYEFEACPDNDLGIRKIIGAWGDILKRREIPEPDRPPVVGPPLPKKRKKPAPLALPPLAGTPAAVTPVVGISDAGLPDFRSPVVGSSGAESPQAESPVGDCFSAAETRAAAAAAVVTVLEAMVPEAVVPEAVVPGSAVAGPVSPAPVGSPRPTPDAAQRLDSLRARVARGEARLREFDLEGFRFIKPNLATCHLLLNLEADLGSEQAMLDFLREGLAEVGQYSAADLATYEQEYRRLIQIARQVAVEINGTPVG